MIYIALDAAILCTATFIAVKYIRNPYLGLLFLSSCVFIAHSAVNLRYGIGGQPNATVVYQNVPLLQIAHKALSLIIVIYIFVKFLQRLSSIEFQKIKLFLYSIFLSVALLTFSFIFYRQPYYDIYYHDIVGELFFLSLLAALYCMRTTVDKAFISHGYSYFLALGLLCVCVSALEIGLLRVQAATNYEVFEESYHFIVAYRASGIFMNPNWAANWAAFFAAASILVYQHGLLRRHALLGLAIAVIIIFLSGSRGGMLTFLVMSFVLLAAGIFFCARRSLTACVVAVATFAAANAVGFLAGAIWPQGPVAIRLYGLFFRWILESNRLGTYAYQLLLSKLTGSAPPPVMRGGGAAVESISGRLEGTGADNGFLSFYSSGGILGVVAIAIVFAACIAAIFLTAAKSRRHPQLKLLIPVAISGTLSVAILAMQLRAFSVFPVWIFAATILAAVLSIPTLEERRQEPGK